MRDLPAKGIPRAYPGISRQGLMRVGSKGGGASRLFFVYTPYFPIAGAAKFIPSSADLPLPGINQGDDAAAAHLCITVNVFDLSTSRPAC